MAIIRAETSLSMYSLIHRGRMLSRAINPSPYTLYLAASQNSVMLSFADLRMLFKCYGSIQYAERPISSTHPRHYFRLSITVSGPLSTLVAPARVFDAAQQAPVKAISRSQTRHNQAHAHPLKTLVGTRHASLFDFEQVNKASHSLPLLPHCIYTGLGVSALLAQLGALSLRLGTQWLHSQPPKGTC